MWTTLSVSRWFFLLSVSVVMVLSVSQVDSYVPIVGLTCCSNVSTRKVPRIKECYEQKPREDCKHHAFLITNGRGRKLCIDPTSQWLKEKIEKKELECPPDLSLYEVEA